MTGLLNSKRFLSDPSISLRALDERESSPSSPLSKVSYSDSVVLETSPTFGDKLERINAARGIRERRSRAQSIGHRERERPTVNTSDSRSHSPKSLDLEEATLRRSSSGHLRSGTPPLTRSLSEGQLHDVLDGFLRLEFELKEAKGECDADVRLIMDAAIETLLPKRDGEADPSLNTLLSIANQTLALQLPSIKNGGLKPIVSKIQALQRECDPDWPAKFLLTRLLLSISNVNRVLQQFELDLPSPFSQLTQSRRTSLSGDSTNNLRELDSSTISYSPPNETEDSTEVLNVFFEFDMSGIVRYVSPSCIDVLGMSPSELLGMRDRDLLSAEDLPTWEKSFGYLLAEPNSIAHVTCNFVLKDRTVLLDGKGMLNVEFTDQNARFIWVFRAGSETESEDLEGDQPDEILCHICQLTIPKEYFAKHSENCGDLLESENAVKVANDKLRELKEVVLTIHGKQSRHHTISRFLKKIDAALALDVDGISIEEANSGKLKDPILIWSKQFPKKALRDVPNLQEVGEALRSGIQEKILGLMSLKKALVRSEQPIESPAFLTPSSSQISFGGNQSPTLDVIKRSHSVENSPPSPTLAKFGKSRPRSSSSPLPTIQDFEIIKPISKGAYGKVFLAKKNFSNFYYAIKILRKDEMIRKNQVKNVNQERKILTRMNSPFLVKLYYSFQSTNHLYLVQEYCNGGDCGSMLKLIGYLDEKWARQYIAEVVLALEYIHSQGIVHRDLKPDNLLIDSMGHIKLTDFGLSRIGFLRRNNLQKKNSSSVSRTHESSPERMLMLERDLSNPNFKAQFAGTPDYLAPEVILGVTELGPEVDWWALGVIFYQFLYGYPPFNADSPYHIFEKILNRTISWDHPEAPPSPEALDFMDKLLNMDPAGRLGSRGAEEVKKHPLFHGIDWENLRSSETAFIPNTVDSEDTNYFDSRGLTLKDLEKEYIQPSTPEEPPPPSTPESFPGLGIDVAKSPRHHRAKSGSTSDFDDFVFKNAAHLREQNEMEAERHQVAPGSPPAPRSPQTGRRGSLPSKAKAAGKLPRGKAEDQGILIVDSNPITSKLLDTIFKKAGFGCHLVKDATAAVLAATTGEHRFSLIFIDREIPDGGAERAATLIKAVKGPNQSSPIIATVFEKNLGLSKAFDDILIKPFSKGDVEEKLNAWVK